MKKPSAGSSDPKRTAVTSSPTPWEMPPILFEDARFIVVNKPAGLLSIPGRETGEVNLLELLRERGGSSGSSAESGAQYLVVHRIDRETSGVILFAKDEESHRVANGWFLKHEVKKEYLALAEGSPLVPALRVNRPIEGKASLSQIQVVERFPHAFTESMKDSPASAFLARVRIASGRRHQIRIHLQVEGFPILGDVKYGGRKEYLLGAGLAGEEKSTPVKTRALEVSRVALHAEKLVLPATPALGMLAPVEIVAPMPQDMLDWCETLRGKTWNADPQNKSGADPKFFTRGKS